MDNITHTLAAVAIGKTRVGRASRLALPALVVAANVPDLDFLAGYLGGPAGYFAHHRGITHSLVGVLLQAPLLATLFWALERRMRRRQARAGAIPPPATPASWRGLLLASLLGLATQPLFDWFNTYGIRPWLPFDGTWYYGDLAFIVDPWLWLLFGGSACLAGRRSRSGNLGYALVAALGTVFVLERSINGLPRLPGALVTTWLVAVALLAVARRRGTGQARPHAVLVAGAALSALYLAGLAWAGRSSWERFSPGLIASFQTGESLQNHMWSPQPANPLAWTLIAQTQEAVYIQPVELPGDGGPVTRLPRNLEHPAVRAALATPAGRTWRSFARFPIAQVLHASEQVRVLLLDARYPVLPPERNWCRMVIDVPPE